MTVSLEYCDTTVRHKFTKSLEHPKDYRGRVHQDEDDILQYFSLLLIPYTDKMQANFQPSHSLTISRKNFLNIPFHAVRLFIMFSLEHCRVPT